MNDHRSATRAELAPLQIWASKQTPKTTTIEPPSRSWVSFTSRQPASEQPPTYLREPAPALEKTTVQRRQAPRTKSPRNAATRVESTTAWRNFYRSVAAARNSGERERGSRRPKGRARRRHSHTHATVDHIHPHPIYSPKRTDPGFPNPSAAGADGERRGNPRRRRGNGGETASPSLSPYLERTRERGGNERETSALKPVPSRRLYLGRVCQIGRAHV